MLYILTDAPQNEFGFSKAFVKVFYSGGMCFVASANYYLVGPARETDFFVFFLFSDFEAVCYSAIPLLILQDS